MEIKLDVVLNDSKTIIGFDNKQNNIQILDIVNITNICGFDSDIKCINDKENILFLLSENNIKYIYKSIDDYTIKNHKIDKAIVISVPSNINIEELEYAFFKEAFENNIKIENGFEDKFKEDEILNKTKLSKEQESDINEYKDKVLVILQRFGYDLLKVENRAKLIDKKPPIAKPRHKWTKEISNIKFTAKLRGGEGTAIWKSKNELVLLSGAKLVKNPQLNKDGSINFSAQFAEKFRLDYEDKILDNVTTEDIIFKSPNQLGIFLFFGGQNTWEELKDSTGKSLNDWSVVK